MKAHNYDVSAGGISCSDSLVLDGVTLTLAPKPLSAKEKHAAQAITHMWVKRGEALDNNLHTLNRYGVQLGKKVPLWGGFTGDGDFTLKLWTDRPKLDKDIWARHVAAPSRRRLQTGTSGTTTKVS